MIDEADQPTKEENNDLNQNQNSNIQPQRKNLFILFAIIILVIVLAIIYGVFYFRKTQNNNIESNISRDYQVVGLDDIKTAKIGSIFFWGNDSLNVMSSLVYSTDRQQFGYGIADDGGHYSGDLHYYGKSHYVINKKKEKVYNGGVHDLVLDNNNYAYMVEKEHTYSYDDLIILNGKEIGESTESTKYNLSISKDGKHVLFNNGQNVFVDGKETNDKVEKVNSDSQIAYVKSDNGTSVIVANGKTIDSYDQKKYEISSFIYSDSTNKLAYLVKKFIPDAPYVEAYFMIYNLNNNQNQKIENSFITTNCQQIKNITFNSASTKLIYNAVSDFIANTHYENRDVWVRVEDVN